MYKLYKPIAKISIHAPAKGATTYSAATANGGTNFNPRSREGSDIIKDKLTKSGSEFQSTLPRRERHKMTIADFYMVFISIHAPAKGATYQQTLQQ